MIAHITINVSDYEKSREFYLKALAPLGYEIGKEFADEKVIGLGANDKTDFWIYGGGCKQPMHVAFGAQGMEEVEEFYKAAMAAGGKDNGSPGYHIEYHAGYYGAFVFDPDGHNIEAVWHDPSK
jgi:predicted lactoylglutathione lyase